VQRPLPPVPMILAAMALAAALVRPDTGHAQVRYADLPAGEAYRHCLAEARRDPETGFEAAITWRDEGGGPPARHCVALALFNLGQYGEAAKRLEELAGEMAGATTVERSAILGQAGNVWLRANDLTRAHTVLTRALELDGSDPDLWIDRGEALARAGEYWDAVDDFSAAIDRKPDHVDALIFRAASYRLLDVSDLARDDILRALDIDPDNPEALVERGAIEAGAGDFEAARTAWLRVIAVAPASRGAEAARSALQQMDVKVE
jgi:tetratricopeptide (TPR) repeat protein